MAIVITPALSILEVRAYLAGKRTSIAAKSDDGLDASACSFDLYNCRWPIPQFVDVNNTGDKFKNDFFSFLLDIDEDQTLSAVLTNQNTTESQEITDNTLGEFYDLGDFALRPLVTGAQIQWYKVVQQMGYGKYKLDIQILNGDAVFASKSFCFDVRRFDCDAAHGTIRFETIQTGYIHNGFDYRNIFTRGGDGRNVQGWKQQIRWYGIMMPDKPDEESDFIQMRTRKETQIQQKISDKYKIELHRVHDGFGKHLTNDNFLSTKILVSDYNMNNYQVYRDKELRKVSTDEVGVQRLNSGINLTFTFKEVDEGTLKRVYG